MKDIYGEEYLIISREDYNRMLDRIEELEKIEKEYREYYNKISSEYMEASDKAMLDTMRFLLHNDINITSR
ncbi:MAG: hypothetical protein J1F35_08570 [Erysipelotrichales bacterium]|nr:hypothetical protein [Erysipelotrichales bacterium]